MHRFAADRVVQRNLERWQLILVGAHGKGQGVALGLEEQRARGAVRDFAAAKQDVAQQLVTVVLQREQDAIFDEARQFLLREFEVVGTFLDRTVHHRLGVAQGVDFIERRDRLHRIGGEVETLDPFGILRQQGQCIDDLTRTDERQGQQKHEDCPADEQYVLSGVDDGRGEVVHRCEGDDLEVPIRCRAGNLSGHDEGWRRGRRVQPDDA